MNKKIIKILVVILIIIVCNYVLFTRDDSIRLGLLLSGNNPFISYENIDYENGNSYFNQIEINDKIIYLECKTYGITKVSNCYIC